MLALHTLPLLDCHHRMETMSSTTTTLGRFPMPPVIECTNSLDKCDSFESSQSTADTTLIPCSSFSTDTSPSTALRHRGGAGTPTYTFELPTIVEKGPYKRRLQHPLDCPTSSLHTRWQMIAWTFVFVLALGCIGYMGSPLLSSNPLQMEPLPLEMKRHLLLAKIMQHPPGKSFTIRLQASHVTLLKKAVRRYADCPGVHEIQLDWKGGHPAPEASFLASPKVVPVRNKPLKGVFLLDETVYLTCDDLARGFSEWRKDPSRSVGFIPLFQKGSHYSFLSDRALFVHRSFLPSTTTSTTHACQEWVVSARVAAISRKHAVAVASKSAGTSSYSADPSCHSFVSDSLAVSDLPSTNTIYVGARK